MKESSINSRGQKSSIYDHMAGLDHFRYLPDANLRFETGFTQASKRIFADRYKTSLINGYDQPTR